MLLFCQADVSPVLQSYYQHVLTQHRVIDTTRPWSDSLGDICRVIAVYLVVSSLDAIENHPENAATMSRFLRRAFMADPHTVELVQRWHPLDQTA